MWDEYRDLTSEERLSRIIEILAEGVLRIIEEKKQKASNPALPSDKPRQKQVKSESGVRSESP